MMPVGSSVGVAVGITIDILKFIKCIKIIITGSLLLHYCNNFAIQ